MECTNLTPVRRNTDEIINTFRCIRYGQLDCYKPIMKTEIQKQQLPIFLCCPGKWGNLLTSSTMFLVMEIYFIKKLKDYNISSRFYFLQTVRRNLWAIVSLLYEKDEALQRLFFLQENIIIHGARLLNMMVNGHQRLIYWYFCVIWEWTWLQSAINLMDLSTTTCNNIFINKINTWSDTPLISLHKYRWYMYTIMCFGNHRRIHLTGGGEFNTWNRLQRLSLLLIQTQYEKLVLSQMIKTRMLKEATIKKSGFQKRGP